MINNHFITTLGESRRSGGGAPGTPAKIPLQLLEEPVQEKACPEGLQPMGRPHAGAGEKREEEGTAERSCYGLTTATIPHPLALLGAAG